MKSTAHPLTVPNCPEGLRVVWWAPGSVDTPAAVGVVEIQRTTKEPAGLPGFLRSGRSVVVADEHALTIEAAYEWCDEQDWQELAEWI